MQDFRAFPIFMRQEIWDDLANPDQTQLTRVDRLARYLVNELGLRHPSEPSQAVMSALVGARDNLQIPQLRTLLQTVKSVVRTTVTRANHAGIALPAGTYLEVLPNQVQELPDAVRQQVAPGGFAAVPANVSLDVVWQTARTIPLRSTHRDVQLQRQLERSENIIGLTMPAWLACKWRNLVLPLQLLCLDRWDIDRPSRHCRTCRFLPLKRRRCVAAVRMRCNN